MYILITGTEDRREILQVSGSLLTAEAGQEVIEIDGKWLGVSKKECYYHYPTGEIILYTPAELLEIYREKVLDDCQVKALEIVSIYNYKIDYFQYKEDRGTPLTVEEETERDSWKDKYIQGIEWLKARTDIIETAASIAEIDTEYDKVKTKYEAKKERVI